VSKKGVGLVMHRLLFIFLVCGIGCDYEPGRCPSYSASEFASLESDARSRWPGPGELNLSYLTVYCVDELPVPTAPGTSGVTLGRWEDHIRRSDVYILAFPTLRMGAYSHELVHVTLWNNLGDPDVDHGDGPDGEWDSRHDEFVGEMWGL